LLGVTVRQIGTMHFVSSISYHHYVILFEVHDSFGEV